MSDIKQDLSHCYTVKGIQFLTIKGILLQDKSVQCLRMSASVEETVTGLLSQPSADVLLLEDIQFTSEQWQRMCLWRGQQAGNAGTVYVHASKLFQDLLQAKVFLTEQY